MSIENVKSKIKALLAKAASTEFDGERDSLYAKAYELMERYQVDAFMLGDDDPVGVTEGVTAQAGPPSYKSDVQRALARFYGCKTVRNFFTHKKWRLDIIGPESARITTELMTPFVWDQVLKAADQMVVDGLARNKQIGTRDVAKALCNRIFIEVAAREAAERADPTEAESRALAVFDSLADWMAKHYGKLSKGKPRAVELKRSAMEHAAGISIAQQVAGNAPLRLC